MADIEYGEAIINLMASQVRSLAAEHKCAADDVGFYAGLHEQAVTRQHEANEALGELTEALDTLGVLDEVMAVAKPEVFL